MVELLRCAADGRWHGIGLTMAGYGTGHCDGINPCDEDARRKDLGVQCGSAAITAAIRAGTHTGE